MLAEKIMLGVNPILELKTIREQIAFLKKQEDKIKDKINNLLDQTGLEELVIDGEKVFRRMTERRTFDAKTFSSLHSNLYEQFKKTTAVISLEVL